MMRRLIIALVLCLFIGAAINTLVAWALAAWGPGGTTSVSFAGGSMRVVPNAAATVFVYTDATLDSSGMGWAGVYTDREKPPRSGTFRFSMRFQSGWPLRSLGASHQRTSPVASLSTLTTPPVPPSLAAGIPLGKGGPTERRLPLTPLWPGFAVNTAVFAIVPAGYLTWAAWRRSRRKRLLGCCGNCGYPIGVSPVCTECGAPVTPSGSAAA